MMRAQLSGLPGSMAGRSSVPRLAALGCHSAACPLPSAHRGSGGLIPSSAPHRRNRHAHALLTTAAWPGAATASQPPPLELPSNHDVPVLAPDPAYRDPLPLPPPPASATATQVLLYLLRLAFGQAQLTWRLAGALALLAISKAAGLAAPFYFKQAVDAVAGGAGAAAVATATATALVLAGACRAVSGVAKELQGPCCAPVAQDAGRRVSFYTFSHVLGLDLSFHLNRKTGALSRMLERGSRSVSMIFRAIVFSFLPTIVELAAVCVILSKAFHPRVSALVLATFAAYACWTVALTRVAAAIRRSVKNLDNEITGKAVDALLNFETVALFGNAGLEVRQYDSSLTAYQRSVVRLDLAAAALNAGQAVILAGGMTAAMLAAALGPSAGAAAAAATAAATAGGAAVKGVAAAAGGITAGDLVMIQGLLLHLWAPLQFLGWFYRELRQSLVDMEDLLALLRTPSTLPDGNVELPAAATAGPAAAAETVGDANAGLSAAAGNGSTGSGSSTSNSSSTGNGKAQQHQHEVALEERRGSNGRATTTSPGVTTAATTTTSNSQGLRLELRNVRFGYGGRPVLRGVSLEAEPGESIALVGPSGGGKSTLLRLLVRLYDCQEGSVLLNGVDVRQLKQESLRGAVAVVPQDTVLFNDTVLHNVAYGRPGATWGEVQAAAAAAKLDAAVARMPLGWMTVVGERGLKLSGGEKQRVAIARAFLRRPRLLICDEATSALDTATERGIQASLRALAAGRTAVFVAHRLSTVQGCDRIYVLSEGRVAEQGTHAQLMAARGVYFDMWQMQRAQQALEEHLRHDGGSSPSNSSSNYDASEAVGSGVGSSGGGEQQGKAHRSLAAAVQPLVADSGGTGVSSSGSESDDDPDPEGSAAQLQSRHH